MRMKKKFFPRATISIALVIIAIYLLDVFVFVPSNVEIFSSEHLIDGDKTGYLTQYLKLITSKVMEGQIWRPLTSMFLHAGIAHIVFNTITLLGLGIVVEKQIGHIKTFIAFFGSGLFSALLMMPITHIEDGLGASTGIFGLLGVIIVLMIKYKAEFISKIRWYNWIVIVIIASIIIMFLFRGTLIDRAEHLTGAAGGLLMGFILTLNIFTNRTRAGEVTEKTTGV